MAILLKETKNFENPWKLPTNSHSQTSRDLMAKLSVGISRQPNIDIDGISIYLYAGQSRRHI